MKSITGHVLAAALCAVTGLACLGLGLLERQMADAQEGLATMNYGGTERAYDTAERYFGYGRYLPGVGSSLLNDVRARKAAVRYWRQQYREVVPQQPDPVGSVAGDNVDLQLVVADAVYRAGRAQATDRQSLLTAINAGINGYLVVLKSAPLREDAAFNYEYLIRLRDEVDKGRKPTVGQMAAKSPSGVTGASTTNEKNPDFKLYIPLQSDERAKAAGTGKAGPPKRKG